MIHRTLRRNDSPLAATAAVLCLGWLLSCLSCGPLAAQTTRSFRITSCNDDAEEASSGAMDRTSGTLDFRGTSPARVGLRFQSVSIPQGATVSSATISFLADRTDSTSINLVFTGHDTDSASAFTTTSGDITGRTQTTASVTWSPSSWTSGTTYTTSNLSSIVQEIVDRSGWDSFNSMVLIVDTSADRRGSDSCDDGNGPTLSVTYTGIQSTPGGNLCYAVDDDSDHFAILDLSDGSVDTDVGDTGVPDIEAIALDPSDLSLFAADADQLGIINTVTGVFTPLTQTFGTGGGSAGSITFSDVDGLSFNHSTGVLWGTQARSGSDALFQINTSTGAHVPDAFGAGVDYVLITGSGIGSSIDDIAFDPTDGTLYGADTNNSQLITINTSTGAGTVVGPYIGTPDMEGMGFLFDGSLYGTAIARLYAIDKTTGEAVQVGSGDTLDPPGTDFEALDCDYTAVPTRALLTRFAAFADPSGGVMVELETAAEDGAAGFHLYRWDPPSAAWLQVNQGLLAASQGHGLAAVYRVPDPGARGDAQETYVLVEVERRGRQRSYGPFTVAVERREDGFAAPPPSGSVRLPKERASPSVRAGGDPGTLEAYWLKASGSPELKLRARAGGVQFVSAARMAAGFGPSHSEAEINAAILAGNVLLRRFGQSVPWLAAKDGKGMLFYAPGVDSLFTRDDIYRLGLESGAQMAQLLAPYSPGLLPIEQYRYTARAERDEFAALAAAPDPTSDYWFWRVLEAAHPSLGSASLIVKLDGVSTTAQTSRLTLDLYGATSTGVAQEHRVEVAVNGVYVGETRFEGQGAHRASFTLPQTQLLGGDNTVELIARLGAEAPHSIVYVDGVALSYGRRYEATQGELYFSAAASGDVSVSGFSSSKILLLDISTPLQPKRLVLKGRSLIQPTDFGFRLIVEPGAKYYAAEESAIRIPAVEPWSWSATPLRSPSNAADYVVIAPRSLAAGAHRLADYRTSRGLLTRVVELEQVFDEFAYGNPRPKAIGDFVAYASRYWIQPPRFAVLVGDGSFDYRDLLGYGTNLLPPLLAQTPEGLYAADALFAPGTAGGQPEMLIGRIPAMDAGELDTYIDKLEAFEAGTSVRAGRLLALSDRGDQDADFRQSARQAVVGLPPQPEIVELSLEGSTAPLTRAALFAELGTGVGVLSYWGHGAADRLSAEDLLLASDAAAMSNSPFFLASMTCSTNRFELPFLRSLGEELLFAAEGGALAVWSPAGLSYHSQAAILGDHLLETLYSTKAPTLGEALAAVMARHASLPGSGATLRLLNLLGDPALELGE